MDRKRFVSCAALLLLAGAALGQIMPYGGERGGPPRSSVGGGTAGPAQQVAEQGRGAVFVGGGDFVFAGPFMVVDQQGRVKTVNSVHCYYKSGGQTPNADARGREPAFSVWRSALP